MKNFLYENIFFTKKAKTFADLWPCLPESTKLEYKILRKEIIFRNTFILALPTNKNIKKPQTGI